MSAWDVIMILAILALAYWAYPVVKEIMKQCSDGSDLEIGQTHYGNNIMEENSAGGVVYERKDSHILSDSKTANNGFGTIEFQLFHMDSMEYMRTLNPLPELTDLEVKAGWWYRN